MAAPASSAVAVAGRDAAPGEFRLTPASDERLLAAGPLTFATARRASAQGEAVLTAPGAAHEIDCRGVSAADSAGLAVLIDWLGVAKRAGRHLRYTHLPQGLTALAGISDLAQLLERGV
ncbi:MAG TPA: STAS domain-containing protein [Steroidobacteraceae bacterium]|nr:STAS domain-containing protein [Steroidobacteraceae bacterium]